MIIKKIKIINFRNIKKEQITLDKKVNIFIGDNAQGKTNILESIYFLALTKSYRTNDDNLIMKGEQNSKVVADIRDTNVFKNLSVEFVNEEKKVKINNNLINKI